MVLYLVVCTYPTLLLSKYSILRVMRWADKLMKLRVGTTWEEAEGGGKLTRRAAKMPHELKCLQKKHKQLFT